MFCFEFEGRMCVVKCEAWEERVRRVCVCVCERAGYMENGIQQIEQNILQIYSMVMYAVFFF